MQRFSNRWLRNVPTPQEVRETIEVIGFCELIRIWVLEGRSNCNLHLPVFILGCSGVPLTAICGPPSKYVAFSFGETQHCCCRWHEVASTVGRVIVPRRISEDSQSSVSSSGNNMCLHREGRRILQFFDFEALVIVRRCRQQIISLMRRTFLQHLPSDQQPTLALNVCRRVNDNRPVIEVLVRARNFRPGEPGLQTR